MTSSPKTRTVSSIVADVVAANTDEVFALMGNGNAYFTDALVNHDTVRLTTLRHETATVASADAYYRVTRKIAVATTTFGPGFTNALTSIGEAVCSRTPMVIVAGGEPTSGPRPWDVNQPGLVEAMGAVSITVSASNVENDCKSAFEKAYELRLPVVLFIPFDLAKTRVDRELQPDYDATVSRPLAEGASSAKVQGALEQLGRAQRPLIVAGRGAAGAANELALLADRIGALTATSAPARGTFAGRSWDLGVCGGFASTSSFELIRHADLVLAVGVSLNQFTTAFGSQFAPEAMVIQIDIADEPTNPLVDEFIKADALTFTKQLLIELGEVHCGEPRWGGIAEAASSSKLNFDRPQGDPLAEDGKLDPRSAMVALNRILPGNRQVVSDGGHFIGWSSYYFDLPDTDSLTMVGTQFQSIGLGLPSAPGAAIARPDATTIVVAGDGGGLMGLPDLDSLVRVARSAAVIIFNDGCYGAEIHQYGSQGLNENVMEIEAVDFSLIAQGMRAQGVQIRTLADMAKIQSWVDEGAEGTMLIDLQISRTVIAPYILEIIEKTLK